MVNRRTLIPSRWPRWPTAVSCIKRRLQNHNQLFSIGRDGQPLQSMVGLPAAGIAGQFHRTGRGGVGDGKATGQRKYACPAAGRSAEFEHTRAIFVAHVIVLSVARYAHALGIDATISWKVARLIGDILGR